MAAHQAPPSLGFSRQEHWSGLPFPSPMHERKSESEVAQSCPTPSDPMDFSLPGPSVHGISQARVLEWGAIAFSVVTPSQHQRLILNQFVQLVLCPRRQNLCDVEGCLCYIILYKGPEHLRTLVFIESPGINTPQIWRDHCTVVKVKVSHSVVSDSL